MTALGIETATIVCGAGIVVDGVVVAERQTGESRVHAEKLMLLIDEALRQAKLDAHMIDCVAVSIGPGSFTGLRIGLSVAKGLAHALDKPLVAVPTLMALARHAVDAGVVETSFVLPAIDARRDEVYCQLFRLQGKGLEPMWEERDMNLEFLSVALEGMDVTITGDAIEKILSARKLSTLKHAPWEYAACSAATVALMGERMAQSAEFVDATTVEPRYLKEFFTNISNNKANTDGVV